MSSPSESPDFQTLYPWITNEFFERILRRDQEDDSITVNGYMLKAALGKGENNASQMLRTCVTYNKSSVKEVQTISFIIKAALLNAEIVALVNELGLFRKEIIAYQHIIPQVEKLLRSIGDYSKLSAKCYDSDLELSYLVFEDLSVSGYTNVNRRTGLDVEHCKQVLIKAAKWHAATAVLFHENAISVEEYEKSFLQEEVFSGLIVNNMNALAEAVKSIPGREHMSAKFARFANTTAAKIALAATRNDDEFNALCHGDLWCNNTMFRYGFTEDSPTEEVITNTVLVDFQMSFWSAPVLDIIFAFFTSSSDELTENDWDELVRVYHTHLERVLILSNWPKAIPTLEKIQSDRLQRGIFAAAEGMLTQARRIAEDAELAEEINMLDTSEQSQRGRVQMLLNPKIRKIIEVILDYSDKNGYFD